MQFLFAGFILAINDQTAGNVLSNNDHTELDSAAGLHKSQVGRPSGLPNAAQIPIHSQSTSNTYPGYRIGANDGTKHV